MLEIKEVCKSFNTVNVLNNVNLKINEGSIFGLVGVNGAGKSTLLRSICGIYNIDHGEIVLDGYNTYKDESIKSQIFLVSDDPYYPNGATINDLKEFYETFYQIDLEAFYKTLELFKLDPNVSINHFSKGMKRQTSLLIAMAIHPKLLLLDEAFDGLDPVVRLTFKKALYELIEDKSITVIISSHNLKELEDICDSYGILENGKIETYGDLLESKQNVRKYQAVFSEERNSEDFKGLKVLHQSKSGKVWTLVIEGNEEEVNNQLKELGPIYLEDLPVNFEELFIYHMEGHMYE